MAGVVGDSVVCVPSMGIWYGRYDIIPDSGSLLLAGLSLQGVQVLRAKQYFFSSGLIIVIVPEATLHVSE